MADDLKNSIERAISNSYRTVEEQEWHSDQKNLDKQFGSQIDLHNNEVLTLQTKVIRAINKIEKEEAKRFENLYKKELESGKYQQKVRADLLQQESQHYTDQYNLKKGLHTKYVNYLEEERDVRERIAKNGKVSLRDASELYSLKVKQQRLERETAEYQIKLFEDKVNKVKSAFGTITNHIFRRLDELNNIKVFDNWRKGITDLKTQYESNFTEISGRLGVSSGRETHDFIGDVLNETVSNDIYMKGLNFNNEVFPQITEAVKNGFQGEKAQDVAFSNAIDKKIMPWLDTTSETWTNLQYNLDDSLLRQLKGQQLQLQATQEGNRILQNGVVSALLDELSPTLLNIDANTTDVTALSGQAQSIVSSLIDNGYSKQDAIKAANQMIDAYQNPYKALSSGNTADKLYALGSLKTGDLAGGINFANNFLQTGANGNWATSGAFQAQGFVTNGMTRTTDWIRDMNKATQAANQYNGQNLASSYNNANNNLLNYVTATQQNDNERQNEAVKTNFEDAFGNHLLDVDLMILDEIKAIKTWLITGVLAGIVTKLGNKLIDKIAGNLGGKVGDKVAGEGIKKILGKLTEGGIKNKLSGSALVAGGALEVIAGGKIIQESNNTLNDKTSSDVDKKYAKANKAMGGTAIGAGSVAAGAGIATLAGAAGAIPVVGWAALAIGGLAIGAKKVSDHLKELDDATAQISANFDASHDAIESERKGREDQLLAIKDNIDSYRTTDEKLEYLRKNGLEPNINAQGDVNAQLHEYLNNLIKANDQDAEKAENILDDIEAKLKNDTNQNIDVIKEDLLKNFNAEAIAQREGLTIGKDNDKIWNFQKTALKKVGYTEEQLLALQHHYKNGPVKSKELKSFLNSGAVQGKNIGSFEDQYEKGNVSAGGVNYLLEQIGSTNRMVDMNQITSELKPSVEKIAILKRWKDDNKTSVDYNEETYEQYKNDILSLPDKYKTSLKYIFDAINEPDALDDWPNSLKGFKTGSSYIPYDMIAQLHAGERVLTANQNKEYTEELTTGNKSIIVNSIQDIVTAIQNQTKTIIDYLSTMNFNSIDMSVTKKINMHSSMGNTKVTY